MRALAWQHNWQTIIQSLRVVGDADEEQRLIETLSRPQAATVLGFVNAHAMNLVARDNDYYQALSAADVLLRDGSGMSILFRRLGREPGLNMNGTDLIPKLLAAYKGRRVALWGTARTFPGQCGTALRGGMGGQCGVCPPWFRRGADLPGPCPATSAGTGGVGHGHAQAGSRCCQAGGQRRAVPDRVWRGDPGLSRRQGESRSAMDAWPGLRMGVQADQ